MKSATTDNHRRCALLYTLARKSRNIKLPSLMRCGSCKAQRICTRALPVISGLPIALVCSSKSPCSLLDVTAETTTEQSLRTILRLVASWDQSWFIFGKECIEGKSPSGVHHGPCPWWTTLIANLLYSVFGTTVVLSIRGFGPSGGIAFACGAAARCRAHRTFPKHTSVSRTFWEPHPQRCPVECGIMD